MTKTAEADVFREPVAGANRQQKFQMPIPSELKARNARKVEVSVRLRKCTGFMGTR